VITSGRRLTAHEIVEGQTITPLELPISYGMVAGIVGGGRDPFPGHNDPAYAQAQGNRTIYANTTFLQAFLDRTVLDWAGPAWMVRYRSIAMRQSVFPGDLLVGTGTVTDVRTGEDGVPLVSLTVQVCVDHEPRVDGEIVLAGSPRVTR
jgi:acyl dehydratase